MSHVVTVLGVLVLLIGLIGLIGWVDVYQRTSGTIQTLNQISGTAQQASNILGIIPSWVPIIGGGASALSGVTKDIANAVGTLATAISLFLIYNLMQNVALIFVGVALIDIGMGHQKLKNVVKDTREYLRQEREKKKD